MWLVFNTTFNNIHILPILQVSALVSGVNFITIGYTTLHNESNSKVCAPLVCVNRKLADLTTSIWLSCRVFFHQKEKQLTLNDRLVSLHFFWKGSCSFTFFSSLCCVLFLLCVFFVFVLCLVCPMLWVSLNCPFFGFL